VSGDIAGEAAAGERHPPAGMSKARLEAFSDGVIAIAITLLVLDLRIPHVGGRSLGHKLGEQWPSFAAYVISFLTIGIIWINHHAALRRLRLVDHSVLILNLLLLLTIGILPWSTALVAEYLRQSSGQHLAAGVYAGSFLLMSVVFYALQHHTLLRREHLLHDDVRASDRARIARRASGGLAPYVLASALAPVSAYATLAICGAVAVYYAIPFTLEE
jgi:uncharacterized membrane protein